MSLSCKLLSRSCGACPRRTRRKLLSPPRAVALHFTMMKVANNIAGRSEPDARTVAALASLGKAYARQLETMQSLQGKRTSRQKITVRNERHVHNHQHVHVTGRGAEIGGQPQASDARCFPVVAALPSDDETGAILPISCRVGQARVPDAGGKTERSAEG